MQRKSEFQTVASETNRGVTSSNGNVDSRRNRSESVFFGNAPESEIQKYRPCKVCKGHHGVWRCDKFKDLPVQERWNTAKRLKVCFRCLGGAHRGQTCVKTRVCGISNCKDNHNRLLHVSKEQTQADQRQPVETGPTTDKNEAAHGISNTKSETKPENEKVSLVLLPPREPGDKQAERSHTTTTAEGTQTGFLALRTVPVILKNGNRAIKVNALLDEASTKTYINANVASELGLQGISRKVTVNVFNGQTEKFETMPVDVELESLDGSESKTVSAFTTERVTGNLEAIDWRKDANKWPHLRGIQFPKPGPHPLVDILIGVAHVNQSALFIQGCQRKTRRASGQINPLRMDVRWTFQHPEKRRPADQFHSHVLCQRAARKLRGDKQPASKILGDRKLCDINGVPPVDYR